MIRIPAGRTIAITGSALSSGAAWWSKSGVDLVRIGAVSSTPLYLGPFATDVNVEVLMDAGTFSHSFVGDDQQVPESLIADTPSVSLTGAYVVKTSDSGRDFNLNAAAGQAITLPPATGSGRKYTFNVETTISSNTSTIKVANSSDTMAGVAKMGSSGGTSNIFGTAATSDTITMNGTTQGGIAGTRVIIEDFAVNKYVVDYNGVCSGISVTPFSATV